jgi:hypothetical protein
MHISLFLQHMADTDTSRAATKQRDEAQNEKDESENGNRQYVKSPHDTTV